MKVIHLSSGEVCEAHMLKPPKGINNLEIFEFLRTLKGYQFKYNTKESVHFTHTEHGYPSDVTLRAWNWLVVATNTEGFKLVTVYSDDNFNHFFKGIQE